MTDYRNERTVHLGEIVFECKYDYNPPILADEQGIDPPEPASVSNLEIWHMGQDFSDLLHPIIEKQIVRIILEGEQS